VRNLGFLVLRRSLDLVVVLSAALVPAAIGQTTAGCAEKPCAYMECGPARHRGGWSGDEVFGERKDGLRSSRARGGLECGLVLVRIGRWV